MNDSWLNAAFQDDTIAAELLLIISQSSSSTSSSLKPLLPPISWGKKQLRSTPTRKYYSSKTTSSATRHSPRTPLSWSGGAATASPSDDSYEILSASRSKNFSPIKEEETELVKERAILKRDLKSMHVNVKEQRNRSDKLKRIKFDLNQQSNEGGALSTETEVLYAKHQSQMKASTANLHQPILSRHAIGKEPAFCGTQEVAETSKRGFVMPDLNMPVGDDEVAAELW